MVLYADSDSETHVNIIGNCNSVIDTTLVIPLVIIQHYPKNTLAALNNWKLKQVQLHVLP